MSSYIPHHNGPFLWEKLDESERIPSFYHHFSCPHLPPSSHWSTYGLHSWAAAMPWQNSMEFYRLIMLSIQPWKYSLFFISTKYINILLKFNLESLIYIKILIFLFFFCPCISWKGSWRRPKIHLERPMFIFALDDLASCSLKLK